MGSVPLVGQSDRTSGLVAYPREAVGPAPQLPGFSGQACWMVGTEYYVQ